MSEFFLGLDIGEKRIGIALSESRITGPRPLGTFKRAQGCAEREILKLIEKFSIRTVVAGLPLDESGRPTKQCDNVRQFCRRLARRAPATVVYQDEYASTYESRERIESNYLSKPSRNLSGMLASRSNNDRGLLDAYSAAIILESYFRDNFNQSSL